MTANPKYNDGIIDLTLQCPMPSSAREERKRKKDR
jgi:hypothetical protein